MRYFNQKGGNYVRKQKFLVFVTLICLVVLLLPLTVSAAGNDYWYTPDNGNTYYYCQNGSFVKDTVLWIGDGYYAFEGSGVMLRDGESWIDGAYRRAKSDGKLYVHSWYEIDGNWYYYGAKGAAADDFTQVGGKWYIFSNGYMQADGAYWSVDYQCWYAISPDGAQSVALRKQNGWVYAFGEYYYMEYGTPMQYELATIGGVKYHFDGNRQMAKDEIRYVYGHFSDGWDSGYCYFTSTGAMLTGNKWAKLDGKWYCAKPDGMLYDDGIFNIGGTLYLFENYEMVDVPGEYSYYESYQDYHIFVTKTGALLRNAWREDKINYNGWAYYGSDGKRVSHGATQIGGKAYYFDNYVMQANTVEYYNSSVYIFGADGKGKAAPLGWFTHPVTGKWMYNDNGDLPSGPLVIGGKTYYFTRGVMQTNTLRFVSGSVYAAFDADGVMVTKPGWANVDSTWYWVKDSTGNLDSGWKQINGNWYNFSPGMKNNTVFYDSEYKAYYVADNSGVCTKLTGNGLKKFANFQVYLTNGVPLVSSWKQIDGAWYYFDDSGMAAQNGLYYINEKAYLFDEGGRLHTSGWLKLNDYDYYYAGGDGIAYTGLKTIGGKQYLFSSWGGLYETGSYYYDGKEYQLNNGAVMFDLESDGWKSYNNQWYYIKNGYVVSDRRMTIDGKEYGFNNDGVMCANGIYEVKWNYYLFGANGVIRTGWQQYNGKWYYGNTSLYTDGVYEIDSKEYLFKNCVMQTGTQYYGGEIYTINASGVIQSRTALPDGWSYNEEGTFYYEDGKPVNGWVGNYYVAWGRLLVNTTVEYNGSYYYLGVDGSYVKNGWYELPYGEYIYAKSGGTLCCNEWLKLGGVYYYFSDIYMVYDGIYEIDGEECEFDGNGKYLGKVTTTNKEMPVKEDGWQKISGAWYYYHAGQPVTGTRYINGKYYGFDSTGEMITNGWNAYYYFGADGVRVEHIGWKLIDNQWFYFNADYTLVFGWISSKGGYYYLYSYYDWDDESVCTYLVQDDYMTDVYGQLFYFDSTGFSNGPITKDGWYSTANGQWYYLHNGRVADGYLKIDGVGYCFYEGWMVTDDWASVENGDNWGYKYFGADGKEVTKQGWYQLGWNDKWVYVGADGYLYTDGIYKIGGVNYSFCGPYWVKK